MSVAEISLWSKRTQKHHSKNRRKKTLSFSTALSLLQQTEHRSSSNTKHYVCAFVSQGLVIPRATNRKYPSERMNLRAVSRGCCGWICWCWLAYLSQKAASAVQKRGGWCHMSLLRESVMNMSRTVLHKASLYPSALSFPDFFFCGVVGCCTGLSILDFMQNLWFRLSSLKRPKN